MALSSGMVRIVVKILGEGSEGVEIERGVVGYRKTHLVASKIASIGCGSEG